MTTAHPAQPTTAIATMLPHAHIRLPLGKLSAWLLVGATVVALGAGPAAGALFGGPNWLRASLLAAGALAAGTLLGVLFLGLFSPRSAVNWALLIITGSAIRMATGLILAMALYLSLLPGKAAFWTAFLAAALCQLALEVIVLRPALLAAPADAKAESPRT